MKHSIRFVDSRVRFARESGGHGVRIGATLSEVLVALLIMAIGVISLASLFPISVLKTARAAQLTSAADIAYNAKAWIALFPHIVQGTDPAYFFDPLALIPERQPPLAPLAMETKLGLLPRYGGGFEVNAGAAERICGTQDSWSNAHDGAITSIDPTRTRVQIEGLSAVGLNLTGINQMRVQLAYNGGKNRVTRMITGILPANELTWSEDADGSSALNGGEDLNGNSVIDAHPLPAGITFESARVEYRERRYSWMLTVNHANTNNLVKVVVYFGRAFSPEEEQVFGVQPGMVTVPNLVAGSNITASAPNSKTFNVSWPAGQQPYLKRGGWVLDAENGMWYQIENYSDPVSANSSLITLTEPAQHTIKIAVFPRGVVDVF